MTKPTAKALRESLKPKKPKLTQQQVDDAKLQKELDAFQPFEPITVKSCNKEGAVDLANGLGKANQALRDNLARALHYLDIERREHKKTKALLRKYLPKIKECPKPKG